MRGDAPAFSPGDVVEHYQLVRCIGRGGAGDVWLARDRVLGRKVALKFLRQGAGEIGAGRTLNDLVDEARATARVAHPNVVTVYAVGSFNDAPYLALEYIAGASLRARLSTRAPGVTEALRLAKDIAAALAAAHAMGVLHLDLKPDNVLIGDDGRLRVVDFGLARLMQKERASDDRDGMNVAGTPHYMAPEVWRGEAPAAPADAWSFGVVLCELLCGRVPYDQMSSGSLVSALFSSSETPLPTLPDSVPTEVRALLPRLLAKDARQRPALADVERVLAGVIDRPVFSLGGNPFCGLDAFGEDDAARFFGRETEIEAFITRLERAPFLPVVGHSGAGKSSFVRAGVVPRLRERGPWIVVDLRPGTRPFLSLARALNAARVRGSSRPAHVAIAATVDASADLATVEEDNADVTESGSRPRPAASSSASASSSTGALAQSLFEAPERLALELSELARSAGARVLLYVDQLEEVATVVDDPVVTDRFLQAIAAAGDDANEPVRVVATLRDDFLGRLAAVDALRGAFARVTVLKRPSLPALVEAIIGPLVPGGCGFDDGNLPLEMARAVEHEPSALPLLSFTCALLWERRDAERKLLLRRVYNDLGGVVGALAAHADSVLDALSPQALRLARALLLGLVTTERTRRRRSRNELIAELGKDVDVVINRLVEARLLVVERSAKDDDSEVELAHEALVKNWARLSRFLDESREQLDFANEVQQAADIWQRRGQRSSEVWTGGALEDALARVSSTTLPLSPEARTFIAAGQREQARRQRQRAVVIAALGVVAVAVAIALVVAWSHAVAAADDARTARAIAEREAAAAALSQGDVWTARAKVRTSLELDDSREARALWRNVESDALLFSTRLDSPIADVGFDDDDNLRALHTDNRLFFFAAGTFESSSAAVLARQNAQTNRFAKDGDRVVIGAREIGDVAIVDGLKVTRLADVHEGTITGMVTTPRGIVSAAMDGKVMLVPTGSVTPRALASLGEGVCDLAFADGKLLALTEHALVVFDDADRFVSHPVALSEVDDDETLRRLDATHGAIVAETNKGRLLLLDLTGAVLASALVDDRGTSTLAINRSGTRVATRSSKGAVMLWSVHTDVPRLRPLAWLDAPAGSIGALAFNRDGRLLASGGYDGSVRVWRVDDDTLAARIDPVTQYVHVAVSDDGSRVAEVGDVGVVVRAVDSGRVVGQVSISGVPADVAIDVTGEHVAIGVDRTLIVRSLDGVDRATVEMGAPVRGVVFLGDGAVVAAGRRHLVRVEAHAAQPSRTVELDQNVASIARDADSTRLVVGEDGGSAVILDAHSLAVIRRVEVGDEDVYGVAFNAGGDRFAASSATTTVVYAIDGTELRRLPVEVIEGACTAFDEKGRVIVFAAEGVAAYDVDTGVRAAVPDIYATGSCDVGRSGIGAMRLGDYVLPFDVNRRRFVWFTNGIRDGVIATQHQQPWTDGADLIDFDIGARVACSVDANGSFAVRSVDGVVRGSRVDVDAPRQVEASGDGCVVGQGAKLQRLRMNGDALVADDLADNAVWYSGADERIVVVESINDVLRARLVLDHGERRDRVLSAASALDLAQVTVMAADDHELALIAPGGLALWSLDATTPQALQAPPKETPLPPIDIASAAFGPDRLLALGSNTDHIVVVNRDTGAVYLDELLRGALTRVAFTTTDGRTLLHTGTLLGLTPSFDLTSLVMPRCALLREVVAHAPLLWEGGKGRPAPQTIEACR